MPQILGMKALLPSGIDQRSHLETCFALIPPWLNVCKCFPVVLGPQWEGIVCVMLLKGLNLVSDQRYFYTAWCWHSCQSLIMRLMRSRSCPSDPPGEGGGLRPAVGNSSLSNSRAGGWVRLESESQRRGEMDSCFSAVFLKKGSFFYLKITNTTWLNILNLATDSAGLPQRKSDLNSPLTRVRNSLLSSRTTSGGTNIHWRIWNWYICPVTL